MANIKTAISIEKLLFEEVEALAREMDVPRSRIFALAVQEFIQRHKNGELLDAINDAYSDLPDAEEQTLQQQMRSRHHDLVKDQW